jgi:hypothetical protein
MDSVRAPGVVTAAALAALAVAVPDAARAQVQRAPAPPARGMGLPGALPDRRPLYAVVLPWYNDRDGPVTALWLRHAVPEADAEVWLALGAGWREPGRGPTVAEAGIAAGTLSGWFKATEGRLGYGLSRTHPLAPGWTAAMTVESASLQEPDYIPTAPVFRCDRDAPAAPCDSALVPLTWSDGRDRAAELRIERLDPRGTAMPDTATFTLRLGPGLGRDPAYAQVRAAAQWRRRAGPDAELSVRIGGAWTSRGTPRQSRFGLQGAGPLALWGHPLLRSRGAPLTRVPHFVPGDAHLRAYRRTSPLVRRYVAASATLERAVRWPLGLPGHVGLFAETAWVPGLPARIGREELHEDAAFLFDPRGLPPGEDRAGGAFSAGALRVPPVLADAGATAEVRLPLGVRAALHLPLWASEPQLADRARRWRDPLGDGEPRALGLRWSWTLAWSAPAPPRSAEEGHP